jgi:hypothetical protein
MTTRKILYSPGFGAGWSTWCYGGPEAKLFVCTYQPIIEAIERGEEMSDRHPAVIQCAADFEEKFGDSLYLGGADDLRLTTVEGRFIVNEYDGSESITEEGSDFGWM